MKKIFQIGFIIGFAGFLIFPLMVRGDGGIFPPPNFYLRQAQQKAVIFYDKNIETLILSISFLGNAKDFGWVVPTPSRPEIGEAPDELFTSLEELTRKQTGISYPEWREITPLVGEGVEVLETKEVGIFEIKLLTADDPEALAKWLAENKYQFPKEGSYVLENYVKNKWYFVAAKVRPDLVWTDATAKLMSGHATPLKLTFESKNIIYPMKISSLNKNFEPPINIYNEWQQGSGSTGMIPQILPMPPYERQVGILLYVFANKEKRIPGFTKQYAEILEPQTIEDLAYDSEGNSWIKTDETFVLTKLYRSMSYSEMTDDLILRDEAGGLKTEEKTQTPETKESVSIVPWAKWLENIFYFLTALFLWIVSPIGLIFLIATIFQFLTGSRMVRVLAWFFQGLSVLLWIISMICLLMIKFAIFKWYELALSDKAINAGIVAGAFLMVAMIAVMICQIIWRKKKIMPEIQK